MTKFKLLWGSIIHLNIFYHKFANLPLVIKPTVERFLFYYGEGNIELARQVDIVNFRPQLMVHYILSKNQIAHSQWTFICGYKGTKIKRNVVARLLLKIRP